MFVQNEMIFIQNAIRTEMGPKKYHKWIFTKWTRASFTYAMHIHSRCMKYHKIWEIIGNLN